MSNNKRKALILEGGGVLAAAEIAILSKLEERGIVNLEEFDIFLGASAGSVNALGLACRIPVKDMLELWRKFDEKVIIPKRFVHLGIPFLGWLLDMRHNKVDEFIKENILKECGLPDNTRASEVKNKFGTDFGASSYILERNTGIIFGSKWVDENVDFICKASTGHPLKFPTVKYRFKGSTFNLSDGGIICNAPVLALLEFDKNEIDEVVCLSISGKSEFKPSRFDMISHVILGIVSGLVTSNEAVAYYVGKANWGNKFKLFQCELDFVRIFDFNKIGEVIDYSLKYAETIEPGLDKFGLITNQSEE